STNTPATHNHQHSVPTRRSSDLAPRFDSPKRKKKRLGNTTMNISVRRLRSIRRTSRPSAVRLKPPSGGASRSCGATADEVIAKRSEEHTSELQSRVDIVCRLLLE